MLPFSVLPKPIGIDPDSVHSVFLYKNNREAISPSLTKSSHAFIITLIANGGEMSPVAYKIVYKIIHSPEADGLAVSYGKAAKSVLQYSDEIELLLTALNNSREANKETGSWIRTRIFPPKPGNLPSARSKELKKRFGPFSWMSRNAFPSRLPMDNRGLKFIKRKGNCFDYDRDVS
jgi:hypothetical protein